MIDNNLKLKLFALSGEHTFIYKSFYFSFKGVYTFTLSRALFDNYILVDVEGVMDVLV